MRHSCRTGSRPGTEPPIQPASKGTTPLAMPPSPTLGSQTAPPAPYAFGHILVPPRRERVREEGRLLQYYYVANMPYKCVLNAATSSGILPASSRNNYRAERSLLQLDGHSQDLLVIPLLVSRQSLSSLSLTVASLSLTVASPSLTLADPRLLFVSLVLGPSGLSGLSGFLQVCCMHSRGGIYYASTSSTSSA